MHAGRGSLILGGLLFMQALAAQQDSLPPAAADTVIITGGVPEPAGRSNAVLPDTLDWRARHSPHKASILSAVLPGTGQLYNRKYWKAPIVWVGMGTCIYFIQDNKREYRRYKDAYLAMIDGDPATEDEFGGAYTPQQLLDVTDQYRRWLDLSYISLGLVYMLNVIDASVDAHFVRFDVSPDLALEVGPSLPIAAQGGAGLSFAFALR